MLQHFRSQHEIIFFVDVSMAREVVGVNVLTEYKNSLFADIESVNARSDSREFDVQVIVGIKDGDITAAHVKHAFAHALGGEPRTSLLDIGDAQGVLHQAVTLKNFREFHFLSSLLVGG